MEELTEAADAVQSKRGQLSRQAASLQDNIARFAKIAQKAKISVKGTDLLRKEEVYGDLAAEFEALAAGNVK